MSSAPIDATASVRSLESRRSRAVVCSLRVIGCLRCVLYVTCHVIAVIALLTLCRSLIATTLYTVVSSKYATAKIPKDSDEGLIVIYIT